ncbi:MAG: family 16 glycosylhydrolase [Bacteroidales bacterium]
MNKIKMRNIKILSLLSFVIGIVACSSSGTDIESTNTISGTPAQISVSYSDTIVDLNVVSSAEWAAFSDESWINCSPSGSVNLTGTVEVSISANTSDDARTGNIVLKSGTTRSLIEVNQSGKPVDTSIIAPEGYELVWNDEFDSNTEPNTEDWYYETGDNGWGNNEIQNYVAGSVGGEQLASIEDGILTITCKKVDDEVCSIRMNTTKSWKYAYVEARLKLPSGKGTWPAFWMMPKNFTSWPGDGEIDIMEEVGYNPNYVSSTIHCDAYNGADGTQKTTQKYLSTAQSDYHIYALEWTADYIKTYVDGELLFTYMNDGSGEAKWPFDAAFYVKLNLAWGGNWGGAQGVDESSLPASYMIDYVRVFQKQ